MQIMKLCLHVVMLLFIYTSKTVKDHLSMSLNFPLRGMVHWGALHACGFL